MFGNAPKPMWERWIPPDDKNRIPLACRCLVVRDRNRVILLESGIGAFFEPAMRERFGVVEDRHILLESLAAVGISPEDVDVIVLSHLHFDHAGGLLTAWQPGSTPALAFPNASYVVGEEAWQRAIKPHSRDRASFIPGLTDQLSKTGRLELVAGDRSDSLGDGFRFHRSSGHTPGLLLTEVEMPEGPVVFAADLIPGKAWVHLPITMGYDRYPEMLIDEKTKLLGELVEKRGRLFFTHDPVVAMSTVGRDERGRYRATEDVESFRGLAA